MPSLSRPSPITGRSPNPALILALVCAAQFVVVLDISVVNVALPSIERELGASPSSLQWIVIAYGLTLGGFLLLGGRLADLFGRRSTLATGLVIFAAASLAGGLSNSLGVLIGARAVQGLGGALALPAALSIVTSTFAEGAARNKALGIFGAVGGGAASVGVIAGGALTDGPGWEWVFLINVPIGIVFAGLVFLLVPPSARAARQSLDLLGAASVTAGVMALVYAINKSVDFGWSSATVLGFLAAGAALLAAFVQIERKVSSPLLPLSMFRHRSLTAALAVSTLLFGSFFATIFQGTLYMQQVLAYSPIRTGVAWLAATAGSFVVAGGVAPAVVGRYGAARTLVVGQLIVAAGLFRLGGIAAGDSYWSGLFPAYLALGLGIGLAVVAIQVAAFRGVPEHASGLAGGMIETSREVGGAVGVAVVATIAIARFDAATADGLGRVAALTEGYQRASVVAGVISLAAALAAGLLLRRTERPATPLQAPEYEGEPVPVGDAA